MVEVDEFEREEPSLRRKMKIIIELADKEGGAEVAGIHEGFPAGVIGAG
jgi:hypothetical protein